MNVMESFKLQGKAAIVTGGAGHLGTSISEGLAEAGANVIIASRDEEKCQKLAETLSERYRVKAKGIKLDIRSPVVIQEAIAKIHSEMGNIDILVNNASFSKGKFVTMAEQDWMEGIDGTINGVFRCIQAVLPYMEKQNSGVIINISSMYGLVSPDPRIYADSGYNNPPNYGAGKAAILQLTRYLAGHFAAKGIRVNSITPGTFPNGTTQDNQAFITNLIEKVPLGRIGRPDDIKGAVVFLASSASSYITGHNLVVDGGWTIW